MNNIYFFTIIISIIYHQIKAATYETPILCLKLNNYQTTTNIHSIYCKQDNYRLFIAQVQYENDYDSYCYNKLIKNNDNNRTTDDAVGDGGGSSKEFNDKKCIAYKKDKITKECNGKSKCDLNLNEHEFNIDEKHIAYKTCNNFIAKRLIISYECINVDYTRSSKVPIDICKARSEILTSEGYIVSPNYPQHYTARLFCKTKIKRNEVKNERIEIYLIKLNTEKQSLITANPTDFLEINKNDMYFGNREYEVIYNETEDANLFFKTDNLFTKGGFLLYYKIIGNRKSSIISASSKRPITQLIIEVSTTSTTTTTKHAVIEIKNTTTINEVVEKMENKSKLFIIDNSTTITSVESFQGLINTDPDRNSNDKGKIIFMILTAIMCALCLVLIAILILFKKRRKNKFTINDLAYSGSSSSSADTKATTADNQRQSQVFVDSSALFTPYNDDSNAHLLLNTSNATEIKQTPTVRLRSPEPQQHEIYEDITLLNNHEDKKLSIGNENHYIDDPTCNNYYCYIKVPDESTTVIVVDTTTVEPPLLPKSSPPSAISPTSSSSIKTPTSTRKFPMDLPASTPNGEFIPPSSSSDKISIQDEDFDYYRVPLNNAPVI